MAYYVVRPRNIPLVCIGGVIAFIVAATILPTEAFRIGSGLAVSVWVFALVVLLVTQRRLDRYMRRYHYSQWADITSGPFWGPGGRNGVRGLRFIFGRGGLQDTELEHMRMQLRRAICWFPVVLATVICLAIAVGVVSFGVSGG